MKKLFIITSFLFSFCVNAQSISPQVINAAGETRNVGSTGATLTDNVGEPFTETLGPNNNIIVTQGFLQPDLTGNLGPVVSLLKNDVSCSDKNDGNISIAITNTSNNFTVNYFWLPSNLCPGNNCNLIDSLKPGTYTVQVVITNTLTNKTDTIKPAPVVINDLNGPCKVKLYNGVTPNGDGANDFWFIENIEEFPENRISIFNRWGSKLDEFKGYNNKDIRWPRKDNERGVPSGTYFYILELGNGTILKGWVEIIN